jgi:hypothetical protein
MFVVRFLEVVFPVRVKAARTMRLIKLCSNVALWKQQIEESVLIDLAIKGEDKVKKTIATMLLASVIFSVESNAQDNEDVCTKYMRTHMKQWIEKAPNFTKDGLLQKNYKEKEYKALLRLMEKFSDLDKCSTEWVPKAKTLESNIDKYFQAKKKVEEFYDSWEQLDEVEKEKVLQDNPDIRMKIGMEQIDSHSAIVISTLDLLSALDINSDFNYGKY